MLHGIWLDAIFQLLFAERIGLYFLLACRMFSWTRGITAPIFGSCYKFTIR